jgi:hypothetical protein
VERTHLRMAAATQLLLAALFTAIPISRMLGASTLRQVLDLDVPMWLVWVANVVELAGAALLLAGLRGPVAAIAGATLIACSMTGATLVHLRAGNLFSEVPWTLVILGLCLSVPVVRRRRREPDAEHAGGG